MGILGIILLFLGMIVFGEAPFSRGQDLFGSRPAAQKIQKVPTLSISVPLESEKVFLPPSFSAPLRQNQIETIPVSPALLAVPRTPASLRPLAPEAPGDFIGPMTVAQTAPLAPAAERARPVSQEQPAAPPKRSDPALMAMIERLDRLEPVPEAPEITFIPETFFAPASVAAVEILPAPAEKPALRKHVRLMKSGGPVSVGRMIHNAIQSDKSLTLAVKLTIRVTAVRGKITLRGVVLNARSIAYVESKARKIAGWSARIDNRLIAIS